MSFQLIDGLYRSRQTVLALLKRRGFNVEPFERFSVREIELMSGAEDSLNFRAEKEDSTDKTICHVIYHLKPIFKKKLGDLLNDLKLSEEEFDKSEFIVLLADDVNEAHHAASMKYWLNNKKKVHFFNLYRLVNNPLDHVLQPKFEVVAVDKHNDLLKALNCNSKQQLPIIKYHADVITRCLGLVPGDIIRITRPSETVGHSIMYSVCSG